MSNNKVEIAAIICTLFCTSMFVLGLAIPTIYYGFADEDSSCQKGTRGGLDLSDWVKGAGFSAVVTTFFVWTMSGMSFLKPDNAILFLTSGVVVLVADVLFWIIWIIWGIVILATNENNSCVFQGKGMAVVAIINIIFGKVRFTYIYMLSSALGSKA